MTRNLIRISDEVEKYGYKPLNSVYFRINQNHFRIDKTIKKLINNYENCKKNSLNCEKKTNPIVKKLLTKNYILIINND